MLCYSFTYIYIYIYIRRGFDNTGFKIKHSVHIITGSAVSSLKNSWCAPLIQLIHNLYYYHCHVNHGPDQQVSWRKKGQAVHYYQFPELLIFHTHFSSGRPPNAAALNAARLLIECGVENGSISGSYGLGGHRNVGSTTCPGDSLYTVIQSWPNFSTILVCA